MTHERYGAPLWSGLGHDGPVATTSASHGEPIRVHVRGDLLQAVLAPDEIVLWQGGPDPSVTFARQDVFLELGAFVFTSLAVVVFVGSFGTTVSFQILTGGILGFALYCVAGRFLYKKYDRRRTVYAVTTKRVLVLRNKGLDVTSVPSSERPRKVERHNDRVHGTMSWGTSGYAESIGELMSVRREPGWIRGTYWPSFGGSEGVSLWDVEDFDELLNAVSVARDGNLGGQTGGGRH